MHLSLMNPNLKEVLESRIVVRSHQPGGPHFIDLMHDGGLYVAFGPYIHPDVAAREAARLREFIALILEPAHKAATMPLPIPNDIEYWLLKVDALSE